MAIDGSDIVLNGHKYLLQEMWSNQAGGCFIPSNVPTLPVEVSYQVKGTSSPLSPPFFIYWSGGVLRDAQLSTVSQKLDVDQLSSWNVTSLLRGSTATIRYQTPQSTTGTVRSAESIAFTYYEQDFVDFGFSVVGGGSGYSSPSITVMQFGYPETVGSSSQWVDVQSSYNYADPLVGSGPNERWESQSPIGTVTSAGNVSVGYHHQYLVSFKVTDASGSKTLAPTSFELQSSSQPNATLSVQGETAWLDAGSASVVTQVVWEGVNVTPSPPGNIVTVESPGVVTIPARVYDATLKVTDWLRFPVSGATANIQLVNGTSLRETTGSDGEVTLMSVPLGRFNATISYLGLSQRVDAQVSLGNGQVPVTLFSSLPDLGGIVALVAVVSVASAFVAMRRRRRPWVY